MRVSGSTVRVRRRRTGSYRKVLVAADAARAVIEVSAISTLLALLGFGLYLLVYPSGIVLFEALVWSIEAMAFTGVALALRIASSRTLAYRARYEIFRVEALSVSALSLVGIIVTLLVVYKTVAGEREPTPIYLSLYPLASAAVSHYLEFMLSRRSGGLRIKLVSLGAISSKLRYDVAVEAAGGVSIIVSNVFHDPMAETLIILAVAVYVIYGLLGLFTENMYYIAGPGPRHRRAAIEKLIRRIALERGYRVYRVRVEVYGTFAEAEVWIRMDPSMRLLDAHRESKLLAKTLVREIPDLLRVVVIPIPTGARAGRRRGPGMTSPVGGSPG